MGEFKVFDVEFEVEDKRQSEYTELYEVVRNMKPGDKKGVGPFTKKQAASVQTSVTSNCKKQVPGIRTTIRDIKGNVPTATTTDFYLIIWVSKPEAE